MGPPTPYPKARRFELEWVLRYYARELRSRERMDLTTATRLEIHATLTAAASMRQALADLKSADGGHYDAIPQILDDTLDVQKRLHKLIRSCLDTLGTSTDDQRLISAVHSVSDPVDACGGEWSPCIPLDEYITRLESDAPLPGDDGPTGLAFSWVREGLLSYLGNLVHRSPHHAGSRPRPRAFIFLLRDTLLLYLGARRLQALGWPIDVTAILLNRGLLKHMCPTQPYLYDTLIDSLFEAIRLARTRRFGPTFMARYGRVLAGIPGDALKALRQFVEDYLERRLVPGVRYRAVDTGAHGTMPLLLTATTSRVAHVELYTAVPWLQDFFGEILFSRDSVMLRHLEALYCQERLFRFDSVEGSDILVRETTDRTIVASARRELAAFLTSVDRRYARAPE